MLVKLILIGMTLCSVVSCRKDTNDATANLIDILQEDLQTNDTQVIDNVKITNSTELFSDINTNVDFDRHYQGNSTQDTNQQIVVINDTIEETIPMTRIEEPARRIQQEKVATSYRKTARMKTDLYVVQNDIYVKVGTDKSNSILGKGKKITTVVFPKRQAALVDIYIYAIPRFSRLVRNNNTLIGYAKNVEFVNQQAQFTRYWVGKKTSGQWMNKGMYNIYVESHYKSSRGAIIGKVGRFWGGNHRKWTITL